GDGLNDGDEVALGTDPNNADSDGDGLDDLVDDDPLVVYTTPTTTTTTTTTAPTTTTEPEPQTLPDTAAEPTTKGPGCNATGNAPVSPLGLGLVFGLLSLRRRSLRAPSFFTTFFGRN
ncbi:MAG: hypothetical protein GWP91_23505, partial [Rhodobacterales bacterium]|nr:hypothetical protein [Rhodobacterales bacterium]